MPWVPDTAHTPFPLDEATLKTIGSPEGPPVAVRVAEPPTVPEAGGVKVIVWVSFYVGEHVTGVGDAPTPRGGGDIDVEAADAGRQPDGGGDLSRRHHVHRGGGDGGDAGGGVLAHRVAAKSLVTKMSEPDTVMPVGPSSPVMSEALTGAPEVVYSPTVLFSIVGDEDVGARHGDAVGIIEPGDERGVDGGSRGGVLAHRAGAVVGDEEVGARHGDAGGTIEPGDRARR